MSESGWDVVIGEIVATFGLKGEVKVLAKTDFPEHFKTLEEVCIGRTEADRRVLKIENVRFHKGVVLLKFAGMDHISDVEMLRGMTVFVREMEKAPLGEGEYYIDDIIGLDVVTTEGKDLGRITEVLRSPANDVYVTDRAMIPAVKEFVVSIDLDEKKMVVKPVEGLERE